MAATPPQTTSFSYSGAAWHFDDDTVSRSVTVTWDQWRGYQSVTTENGTAPDPVTETVDTYLQGMSDDENTNPLDVAAVYVTSTHGDKVQDSDQYAGMLLEEIEYDGVGSGQQVTDTVYLPWSSTPLGATTSQDKAAYITGGTSTDTYTALAGGGTRESTVTYSYNSYGQVLTDSDVPDTSNASESTCTTSAYVVNAGTSSTPVWLVDLPSSVVVTSGACGSSGGSTISDTEYSYDGQPYGSVPTVGNLTQAQELTSSGSFQIAS